MNTNETKTAFILSLHYPNGQRSKCVVVCDTKDKEETLRKIQNGNTEIEHIEEVPAYTIDTF